MAIDPEFQTQCSFRVLVTENLNNIFFGFEVLVAVS
jgi:hypothetical protein